MLCIPVTRTGITEYSYIGPLSDSFISVYEAVKGRGKNWKEFKEKVFSFWSGNLSFNPVRGIEREIKPAIYGLIYLAIYLVLRVSRRRNPFLFPL